MWIIFLTWFICNTILSFPYMIFFFVLISPVIQFFFLNHFHSYLFNYCLYIDLFIYIYIFHMIHLLIHDSSTFTCLHVYDVFISHAFFFTQYYFTWIHFHMWFFFFFFFTVHLCSHYFHFVHLYSHMISHDSLIDSFRILIFFPHNSFILITSFPFYFPFPFMMHLFSFIYYAFIHMWFTYTRYSPVLHVISFSICNDYVMTIYSPDLVCV